ncbi:peptidase [Sphingomonas gilva]|uniref:Peptidase n=1 Tax=Sphingomonas gilva TaxID=2305907 RepID=A0A396RRJ6_9SPHN|nr:peptidase [Sphingomonas gilva]RHW19168.1 peptidase [Sphingomonas gilva]
MTYCIGLKPDGGLIMIADTRTNAGIDSISAFRKLHVMEKDDSRLMVIASAGNLSITQSMLSMLQEGLPPLEAEAPRRTLKTVQTMFQAAQLVGEAVAAARTAIGLHFKGTEINPNASMLLGGRIADGPLSLYLVYGEGNFIECGADTPFFQIGERKYGKPMLDRAMHWGISLGEGVKLGLISFDATMRSNLSVGMPLDLIVIPADRERPIVERRIEPDDAYFAQLSRDWSARLEEDLRGLTPPPFMDGAGGASSPGS